MAKAHELRAEAQQKREAAQALLAQIREGKAENVEVARKDFDALVVRAKELEAEAVREDEYDRQEAELKAAAEDYNRQRPPAPLPGDPTPEAKGGNRAKVTGWQDDGETVLDRRSLTKLYETGTEGPGQKMLAVLADVSYKRAYARYIRGGLGALGPGDLKTIQEGADPLGGFWAPEEIQARVVEKLATPTRVAGRVQNVQTSRDSLAMPAVKYTTDDNYTTGIRVTWTDEIPSSDTAARATEPPFGVVRIPVHTAMMTLVVTNDMVEDSLFPIIDYVTGKYDETVMLTKDDMILNGSGQGRPAGILLNPGTTDQPAVVNSGDANLLTPDGITKIAYSVPEQYQDNATFVMNLTNTGQAIALLKDADNRYLFGMGLQDSGLQTSVLKQTLKGAPVTYSGLMPNVAANAFPLIYGDLQGYCLVTRVGLSIQVLREKYAEVNGVGLVGRIRLGGQVIEPWRLKVQKVAA